MKYRLISPDRQRGVSLIEILVALFTLSIGILGLAAMQAKTLQFNQSAYLRTQATFVANDIIDRMRANPGTTAVPAVYASDLGASVTATEGHACAAAAANCSPAALAAADLAQWKWNLQNQLPNGTGEITGGPTGADDERVYTVSVSWQDRDDELRTFTTEVRM